MQLLLHVMIIATPLMLFLELDVLCVQGSIIEFVSSA